MTVSARAGRLNLRSGRKNACGAVEQKNWIRRLLFGRRLENANPALAAIVEPTLRVLEAARAQLLVYDRAVIPAFKLFDR